MAVAVDVQDLLALDTQYTVVEDLSVDEAIDAFASGSYPERMHSVKPISCQQPS